MSVLRQQSKVTNQKDRDLKNLVDELDDRLRDQEAYTRKDSVRIMNPPFDFSKNETLAEEIIKVFEKYSDVKCITESGCPFSQTNTSRNYAHCDH